MSDPTGQSVRNTLLSFRSRSDVEAFCIRAHWELSGAPFSLRSIHKIASRFVEECLTDADLAASGFAFQVPVGNSVCVFLCSASGVEVKVEHSFGGLFYQEAKNVGYFQIGGFTIQAFMRESEIHASPSFCRIKPNIPIKNNGICWTDSYLTKVLLRDSLKQSHLVPGVRQREIAEPVGTSVCIGIPVYNSPHHFVRLLEDLERTLGGRSDQSISVCIIDDASNLFSEEKLRDCTSRLREALPGVEVVLHRNQGNEGFIRTSNKLFAKAVASGAEVFILLTTDIRLPPSWLDRMLAPFSAQPLAAVATPLAVNGSNLNVVLDPAEDWISRDAALAAKSPRYPDAETTVGYCMAVRCASLGADEPLFSLVFENGYGDDSDLYFRLIARGLRGVAVDNLLIYHSAGGSFDSLDDAERLRSENFVRFAERWMVPYLDRMAEPKAGMQPRVDKIFRAASSCEVLFIVPSDDRRVGGVQAVFRLVEGLRERGLDAHIATLNLSAREGAAGQYRAAHIPKVTSLDEVEAICGRPKIIIATGHDTVPYALSLKRIWSSEAWYFVQGPEMAFSAGAHSASVIEGLLVVDHVLCVSKYLADLIYDLANISARVIPYGPDELEFYDVGRSTRTGVAIQFAGRDDKGSDYAGIVVPSLLRQGYEVTAFGDPPSHFDYDKRIQVVGFATPQKLRKIFQSVEYYIDLSHYEGLGMLPLEALFCGAIPVTMRNGGAAREILDAGAGLELRNIEELQRVGEMLRSLGRIEKYREKSAEVRSSHNLTAALDALWQELKSHDR